MKRILLLSFILFYSLFSNAQTGPVSSDTCHLRISLLTCTPGAELYSTFGHSALRVINSDQGYDIIFNYGTFDFEDPDFYQKFVKGKLLYFVSIDELTNFVEQYEYEGRGIIEQELNLSCPEKEEMLAFLFENAKEENKYYKYDFVYDNCTTRLRDILERFSKDSLITKNIRPKKRTTFRHLIHEYLNRGGQHWSKLGIDALLGKPIDKKISNREAMFLPDYLLKAFDSTTVGSKQLVSDKKTILPPSLQTPGKKILTPLLVFSVMFLLIVLLSFVNSAGAKKILFVSDFLFFFFSGALGLLILFMWFGTDHQACRNNFNIAWALPTHLIAAFLLLSKKGWIKNYFRFVFFFNILLLLVWFFLPQQMNSALLPVVSILCLRSFFLSKNFKNG